MEKDDNPLKQLQVNVHRDSETYSVILNVDEFKNSGSILFIDQAFDFKKLKKYRDSYGIAFVSKIDDIKEVCSLKLTSGDPEAIITLIIGDKISSATVEHVTADFIFYFFRDLKVPTIK